MRPPPSNERLDFGPAKPLPSTWAVLPSEAAKRPGVVTVLGPDGTPLATIDPITRQRRTVTGEVEATLSQQGWGLDMRGTAGVVFSKEPRRVLPDYEGAPARRDRDPRVGSGHGTRRMGGITYRRRESA
jgi:hypothetical protein